MARPYSSTNDQAPTLRNLKVLVALLVVSNILVGVLGGYLLRAVDKRYSDLLDRSVPALNDLRELMTDTVAAMHSTNPRNFSGPDANTPAALLGIQVSLRTAEKFRKELFETGNLKEEPKEQAALRQTGDDFSAAVTEVMEAYAAGKRADAVRIREEKLLPCFDRHMAAIGRAADAVESVSLGVSKDFTDRTNRLTRIVVGVASWPVIMLFALLVLTAGFVIAMMIAFRGKDLADTP